MTSGSKTTGWVVGSEGEGIDIGLGSEIAVGETGMERGTT